MNKSMSSLLLYLCEVVTYHRVSCRHRRDGPRHYQFSDETPCVCVCGYRFCFTVIPLRGCDIIKIPSTQKHKEHKIWFDSTVLCSYHVIIKKKEEAPKNNVSAEKSSNADKVAILNRVKILPNACILHQHLKHKHGSTNALHRPHGLRTTTKVNSC